MEYNFQILTTNGLISSNITSNTDFSCAPFGHVPYRVASSCTCSPDVINEFWIHVDAVLAQNGLTSNAYIRAVRAIQGNNVFGETNEYL